MSRGVSDKVSNCRPVRLVARKDVFGSRLGFSESRLDKRRRFDS
jgi:hypothetical protein